jgi:uncharacterized protein with ATP-grasp and redox domains
MRTYSDCIPCFVRQTLDALRLVTDDEEIHEQALRKVLRAASEMDLTQSPPAMGQYIHRLIRQLTGNNDPYREIKVQCNRSALKVYPELKRRVRQSDDPFKTAVRLAIAGNIIDFGVNSSLDDSHISEAIERCLAAPLAACAVEDFKDALRGAKQILYLADNAGEIVFDRLLIKLMPVEKVTFVVKGSPVINDATMLDALAAGIEDLVEIIDNGSDVPGTILETCSDEFRDSFDAADLIVAKGQGNYETLSDIPKNVFFLLMAKCHVIARDIGCKVGSLVLQKGRSLASVVKERLDA